MSASRNIRVMVVDDNDQVRMSLTLFLEICDDLELVGEASNGRQAVDLISRLHPDVVLMDLVMPEVDGVSATGQIHHAYPKTKVVILTSATDLKMVEAAMQAGATSFLYKNASLDEMANAIRRAHFNNSSIQ